MAWSRFLFTLFFLPLVVNALYNGNPSFPMMPEAGLFIAKDKWLGVKAGYEFDCVYDCKLHRKGRGGEHSRKKVPKFDSLSNLGIVTLTFNERAEFYGALGAMSCKLTQTPFANTHVSYDTTTHFAWGVGGRAIVAYWGDVQLSLNAGYQQSDLPLSSLKVNHVSYSKKHVRFDYREWQVGLGASYRMRWFVPYLGISYLNLRSRIEHLRDLEFLLHKSHVSFKDTDPFGLYLGFGISPDRGMNLNVEARVINENAITVSADIKF